jgi:predicted ATPase
MEANQSLTNPSRDHARAVSPARARSASADKQPMSQEFFLPTGSAKSPSGGEVAPGDRIGKYQLLQPIGRGGMGEVWLARHVQLDVNRAIKLLHPHVSADRRWRARMLREARILASLDHRNIARLFDFIDESDRSCIILEHVTGKTLDRLIDKQPMELASVIAIARQIAQGLAYAHSIDRAVVHRDLKPRNVMVRDDGTVKVLDWGIAQVIHAMTATPDGDSPRQGKSVAGTPGYMSPEQAFGKHADRRADIWALGCLLFEMLTGREAYPYRELDEYVDAVVRSEPDWSLLPADLPDPLQKLVRLCLERDPRQRCDDVNRVLKELDTATDSDRTATALVREPPGEGTAATAAQSNLPPAMASFVGREQILAELKSMLAGSRMVTLTGPGGTGKTTIALRLGRAVLNEPASEEASRFAGGLWLVELSSVTNPDTIAQQIAAVLPAGPPKSTGSDPIDKVAEIIGDRPTLLIIDNCEHLVERCGDVCRTLLRRCGSLRILATSRQPLNVPGERVFRVPPLSIPYTGQSGAEVTPESILSYESVRLFVERAKETRHDFTITPRNAADIARICCLLDGLPLAIELAAARTSAIAVGQLAERLSGAIAFLDRTAPSTGSGGVEVDHRKRTMAATIDWSYNLLSPAEQRLLNRLSVFRRGWTLEAAESVASNDQSCDRTSAAEDAGRDEREPTPLTRAMIPDLLEGLVDKSLVVFEEVDGWPRYRLFETVRRHAEIKLHEQTPPAVIERLHRRHAEYFARFAQSMWEDQAGPKQAVALERIENDKGNFQAAMEWALEREDHADLALRLAHDLHWFYYVRGYWDEGLRWLRVAQQHRPAREDLLQSRACNAVGSLLLARGDIHEGLRMYEQSLSILRKLDDQSRMAGVLNNIGLAAQALNDRHRALDAYQQAVAIYEYLRDPLGRARVLLNLGMLRMSADELSAARSLFEESLSLLSRAGEDARVAEIHQLLCEVAEREGRRDDAVAHCRESLVLWQKIRGHRSVLRNYVFAAVFAADAGQFEDAVRLAGYVDHHSTRDGLLILPDRYHQRLEETLQRCRGELSAAEYDRAWASATALSAAEVCTIFGKVI